VQGEVKETISNTPYNEGETICNIFWPADCVKVKGGSFSLYLENGEVKIFLPKNSMSLIEYWKVKIINNKKK